VVSNAVVTTPVDTPRTMTLGARDADGNALTLRIVSQPVHGTTGLSGTIATYIPESEFSGVDRFTYAAWDGQTDSNLGSITVYVGVDAPPGGEPISAKKLSIKDNAQDSSKRRISFQSRDSAISTISIDPSVDGAYVHVFNSAGGSDSACFYLPPGGNWRALSGGTYRYADSSLAMSPVRAATVGNGRLQVVAKGSGPTPITYRLGEPSQGSVGVVFTSGSTVLCANFGGTVRKDSGTNPPNEGGKGQFSAKDAARPGACPMPPDSCP